MVKTNIQTFTGEVEVLGDLTVGSNLIANSVGSNVLTVTGSIAANTFIGDGGLLSNIASTIDEIIGNPNGNVVSNTLIFESGQDATANTGIVTHDGVGISISNTAPTGAFQLSIGSNIFVNTHASNALTVVGAIGSDLFIGDGGLLSNIATTLDQIVDQGNTVSNTLIFESGQDSALTSNIGLVSRENVGISVSNSNPTGEFQFGVGSNLFVNTYSSNVLTVEGNVLAQKLTFGTATVTSAYNLSHVTAQGSVTDQTISLTNATTGLAVTSNATVGGNVTAETVISTANVEVGDRLKFASNVFVDDLRVADVAANLVTYDKTTGELMDSGGLFANKLAVVSVQPPSALSANTTTIAKHGTYTVTTSGLAEYSNAWNAFDGDSAVEWTSPVTYGEGDGVYSGTSNLFAGNYIQTGVSSAGEWLAIEFPYKTTLRHMKLTPPTTYQQYPASANVYATNDSLTWTELTNWSGVNPGDQQSNVQTIIVNATESFKKYAMVVTKTNGSDTNTALAEWKLFTESFSIDAGKVEMATSAVMGGETTMDQHGPHSRDPKAVPLKKYPEIVFEEGKFDRNDTTNTYTQAGYSVSASSYKNQEAILRSKGLTGPQGYTMSTGYPDLLTDNGGVNGLSGMKSTAPGVNTGRSNSDVIPAGSNPKTSGTLTPTGSRFYWSDLGQDIFDEWGRWYIYNPADQTASHIQFGTLNGPTGTVFTEIQYHVGKTFTIKHGWVARGIFKLDVECEDPTFSFSIGMYGNMGSDSTTENLDKMEQAPWGTLHYNFNRTNSGSAINTDPFYTYLIPKQRSFNDDIVLSGTNFTSKLNTVTSGSAGDDLAIWFDTLQVGATM